MTALKSLSLTFLLLGICTNAQVFQTGGRSEGAFSWVQPEDTIILDQYDASEPVYPSPRIGRAEGWEEGLEKARRFVSQLSLEEKADMVTGQPGPCVGNIYPIPRLNFSGLCLQDGPASLRTADLVSVYPGGVTVASSWDRKLMYDRSIAMGREFRAKGAQIALAPSVGPMGRSAYSGRNWEGFSPEPYLSGINMEQAIHGIQDAGVQATAKHWLLNEQEILRNPVAFANGTLQYESISSNVDDRTVHELYMWPFANAVRANAAAFMCCYNRVNGSYRCQNSKLLNGLLKEELGFKGYVMSDWYATHSGMASIESGLDMDMPGNILPHVVINETRHYSAYFGGNVTAGVNNGTIDVERLDDMITRIMTPYFALHQDEDFPTLIDPSIVRLNTFFPSSTYLREWNLTGTARRDVRDNHGELIRKIAAELTVLLKNTNQTLPLRAPKSIAIFGNDAGPVTEGPLNQANFEFGTLAVGGGSGAALFTSLASPLEAIKKRASQDGALVETWLNNTQVIGRDPNGWGSTPLPNEPEVCLVFVKGWASEAVDRESLELDWQGNELIETVATFCPNTVVVTHSAGINVMPFADHENVTAILVAHYPGQESGNSIVDILYSDVNPSGHLPYTIAYEASDYNGPIVTDIRTSGKDDWQSYFDEKLEIDYRYFDAQNIDVLYEFGFGLSYTTFEINGLTVESINQESVITSRPEECETLPGGNPVLWEVLYTIKTTVHNTGPVRGSVVPQLYVTFPDSTPEGTPPLQLRGFEKIELAPGERSQAKFELMRRDLSYRDIVSQQWLIPEGEFVFSVGFSSRDIVEVVQHTVIEIDSALGSY